MQQFWIIWEIFINSLECYFFYYMIKKQLSYVPKNKAYERIGLGILVACLTAMNSIYLDFRITMIVMFLLVLIFTCTLFRGTMAMKVIWSSCGIIVFLTANLLTSIVLTAMASSDAPVTTSATLSPSFSRIKATLLYVSICILLFVVLSKIPKTKIKLPQSLQIFLILVVLAGTVFAGQMVSLALVAESTSSEQVLLVAYSLSLLLMQFAIVYLVYKIGEVTQKEDIISNQLQNAHLEQKSYCSRREMMKIWDHDYHHHINVLQTYLSQNNTDKAQSYLKKIRNDLNTISISINTGSTVLDAIISNALRVCKSKGIVFNKSIIKLDNFPLGDTETSALFGNLLDNSIEACELYNSQNPVENGNIDLEVFIKRGMYRITIINSSCGVYRCVDGQFQTTKKKGNHGYGIPRIKQIVDDIGGFYDFSESDNTFRVDIFLPSLNFKERQT